MPALTQDELSQILGPQMPTAPPPPPAGPSPDLVMPDVGPMPVSTDIVQARQDAQRQQDLEQAARNTMLQGTDTRTGAPASVRAGVGAFDDPGSRLRTLRNYAPDAQPLPGTDNFVYTDPTTGRRMTYAPIGWRIPTRGDVASLAPEVGEAVGAIGGGIGGTAVGGPVGTAVGAGLGAAAGREGARQVVSLLDPYSSDVRSPGEILREGGLTAAVNAPMPFVGEHIFGPAIGWTANAIRPGATATSDAITDLATRNVAPDLSRVVPAGVATESPSIQRVESITGTLPGGGGVRDAYRATGDQLEQGVSTVAQNARPGGAVPNPETFTSNINNVASNAIDRFNTARETADANAMTLIGANRPVDIAPLRALRDQMVAARDAAPQTLGPRFNAAIDRLNGMIEDAGPGGTLPFSVVRNARTDIGKEVNWLSSGTVQAPTGQPSLQDVYTTLRTALQGTADQAGPLARAALDAHDQMVSAFHAPGGPGETLTRLADPDIKGATITDLTKSTAPQKQADLAQLFVAATPDERNMLTSGVINRLGLNPQGDFQLGNFVRDWTGMTDQTKNLLFTGARAGLRDDLDNLATVSRTMQDAARTVNFSNTTPAWVIWNALHATIGALAAGAPGAAVGTAVGNIGTPLVTAGVLESRPFVRWLTGALSDQSANAVGRWTAQLGGVAEADPRLRGFVADLQRRLGGSSQQ